MKANVTKEKAAFSPITLHLTLESQLEIDAIATLFNSAYINDALRNVTGVEFAVVHPQLSAFRQNTRLNDLHTELRACLK